MASYGAVSGQGLFASAASPAHLLGYATFDECGNRYRYARAGAALSIGDLVQSPAQVTAHQSLTPTADVAAGGTVVRATLGAAAAAANQYAGGWLIVTGAPGLGQRCRISAHEAVISGGVITVRLDATEPLRAAITTASKVSLQANPYDGAMQTPITTLTGAVLGVAVAALASGEYGWLQDDGIAMVKIAGTPAVGAAVVAPGTAAGAVVVGASAATKAVGSMLVTGVNGAVQPVALSL